MDDDGCLRCVRRLLFIIMRKSWYLIPFDTPQTHVFRDRALILYTQLHHF